jgi:hypothetical protein
VPGISPLTTSKCDFDNGGLVLPEGFCATLIAGQLGPVRQLAVAPNGDLYAALSGKPGDNTGGVLAFRDRDGDGKPEERASFGLGEKGGPTSLRASGVAVAPDGSLYIAADQNGKIWKIVRSVKSKE